MNLWSLLRAFAPFAIGCLMIVASAAAAEEQIPASVIEDGHHAYLSLCASCHGESGKGDGPMAPELSAKPVDLTQIARQNKGKFPYWHVFQTIDGRTILRAHGGPEMPVWGSRSEAIYGRIPTREWMLAVTFYIESIQEK
jgi:mono/diheme cytochrome c family protein